MIVVQKKIMRIRAHLQKNIGIMFCGTEIHGEYRQYCERFSQC